MKETSKNTNNRSSYNKLYKRELESNGLISCSRCKYHRGENNGFKHYGGYEGKRITLPNWKLVSKNKKQWMIKPMKLIKKRSKIIGYNLVYVRIVW